MRKKTANTRGMAMRSWRLGMGKAKEDASFMPGDSTFGGWDRSLYTDSDQAL
jgi:hypothetical protein